MTSDQEIELSKIIAACWEAQGRVLSAPALALIVDDLSGYEFMEVIKAVHGVRRKGFIVNAGTVVPQLEKIDGRPSTELAWSMAIESMNEHNSVMLTDEMAAALGSSRPAFEIGDKVAARMAFKETYDRECEKNRSLGLPVKTFFSPGIDKSGRLTAIQKALDIGMINQEKALSLMSVQSIPEIGLLPHQIDKVRGSTHINNLIRLVNLKKDDTQSSH